jgi:hypothetical protein
MRNTANPSPPTKAAWMDLLCHMWWSETRRGLSLTIEEDARLLRTTFEDVERIILELIRLRVVNVEIQSTDVLVLRPA